jgi:hypothetical protein
MRPITRDVSGLVEADALLVVSPVEERSIAEVRVARLAFVSN